jgi:glycosyltransferase involved in cell wall biosynthesis
MRRVVFLTTVFEEVDTGPGIFAHYLWDTFRDSQEFEFHVVAPWFRDQHPRLHAVGDHGGSLALYRRIQRTALVVARAPGSSISILHGNSTHCMGRLTEFEGPLLTQVNDYETATLPESAWGLWREAGSRKLLSTAWRYKEERRVLRHSNLALCNSEYTAETVKRCYGLPVGTFRVVHKAVDTQAFRRPLDLPDDPIPDAPSGLRLAFVGTDWRRKGLDVLLEAVAALAGTDRPATLVIMGPEANDRDLSALVSAFALQDRVRRVGRVSRDTLRSHLWHSDVFVLPSRREALGVAVLEGMAAGLPVVVTSTGGIPEIVRPGVEGYLVDPGSPVALAEALGRLLDDPEGRAAMAGAALRRAEEFSVATMTRAIRDIYLRIGTGASLNCEQTPT